MTENAPCNKCNIAYNESLFMFLSLHIVALLAKINKISEAKLKEDNIHQLSHLDFKYSDMHIHGDFFELIKFMVLEFFAPNKLKML